MVVERDLIVRLLDQHKKKKDPSWWNQEIGADLGLTISDPPDAVLSDEEHATTISPTRRKDLAVKGLALVDQVENPELIVKLRNGIIRLQEQKLPATFIFLFDETWKLAVYSRRILQQACHPKNQLNFDVLAWYIPPGQAGFSPHRDRQPADVASSFHDDAEFGKEPKFVTLWMALSDATPSNSCLYVIPKDCDPGYLAGDNEDKEPLQMALPDKKAYQRIRAVPRQSGQSLLFTHRLIHWGSQSEENHDNPRIAISFVCSDPDYEAPFVDYDFSSAKSHLLPFHLRLLLVCAQLICYHERFDHSKATIKACYDYCKEYENHLGEACRQRVLLEFVAAMEEKKRLLDDTNPTMKVNGCHGCHDDNNQAEDEDEEDAMMEEMLNAEKGGYGEFEDDFDAMEGEDDENSGSDDEEENCEKEDDTDDHDDENDNDNDEDVDIFGKRGLESENSEISKKVKRALLDTDK